MLRFSSKFYATVVDDDIFIFNNEKVPYVTIKIIEQSYKNNTNNDGR